MLFIRCCSRSDDNDGSKIADFNNHIGVFSIYSSNNDYRDGVVTPIEALGVDKKIDDGIPDYGFVAATGPWSGSSYETTTPCYNHNTNGGRDSFYQSANATYQDLNGCQMMFAYDWD